MNAKKKNVLKFGTMGNNKDMDLLKEKIEEKELELKTLRYELSELEKEKYNYLIGKFFKLSATETIKITGIDYIAYDGRPNIEFIKLFGGRYGNGLIDFTINDECFLNLIDIEEGKIREITKEEFMKFFNECLEETKKVITELI